MTKLEGKWVLLTGAGGGIGRATARELAKAGARLVLTDIDEQGLQTTLDALRTYNTELAPRVMNVADPLEVKALAAWVIERFGGIDVLINNAGVGHSGEIAETSIETWQKLMAVNFWGPLYHIYAFLPHMAERGGGQIINISSGQAFFRLPTWGPYTASKIALGTLSETLGFELRKLDIRVTTVYPFMVDTPFYRDIEGETFFQKLSMKLVPLYSMSPERVGRIVRAAVEQQKPVEMVSVLNRFAKWIQAVPLIPRVVGHATIALLGKQEGELRASLAGDRLNQISDQAG